MGRVRSACGLPAWSWRGLQQLGDSNEVVGGGRKREQEADPGGSSVSGLAQERHRLDVAEAFLDPLADALAEPVAGMAGGAPIDRRLTRLAGLGEMRVDGDMRGDVARSEVTDKRGHVEPLVAAEGN